MRPINSGELRGNVTPPSSRLARSMTVDARIVILPTQSTAFKPSNRGTPTSSTSRKKRSTKKLEQDRTHVLYATHVSINVAYCGRSLTLLQIEKVANAYVHQNY
ncbi:hypothetical protein HYALB_00013640 [Hymenoscyphus albidus]|uniref:Uncharacterized protein n=1 Tax=Hymenoscyphus albidus TaxID=595503 RepID=A0A9N9QAS2_9HELO|nr:hypothetical protein HYALB_00013640 [Hymenoscyphus albidus]